MKASIERKGTVLDWAQTEMLNWAQSEVFNWAQAEYSIMIKLKGSPYYHGYVDQGTILDLIKEIFNFLIYFYLPLQESNPGLSGESQVYLPLYYLELAEM